MFPRRRLIIRPLAPIRRLGRAAIVGGLGFAAGRATAKPPEAAPAAPSPAPSIESRLAELDRLKAQGLITEAEHAARRAEILREI
jgi:hypothetical protein